MGIHTLIATLLKTSRKLFHTKFSKVVTSEGSGEETDAFEQRHMGTPKKQVIPAA